jgi:uncharacterized protein
MKKYMLFYILYILGILCILCIPSIQAYDYPTIIPYVNDFTNTLTQDQINLLNQHCQEIEQNTSYEIAVVVLNTTDGQDRLDYANHIGENNGVGKKATGTGLVVLWTFENERGLAIATARGAGETYVNDAKAAEIARAARSLFEDGKYYEGFEQILNQLEQTIKERDLENKGTGIGTQLTGPLGNELIILIIVFGAVGIIIWLIIRKASSGGIIPIGTGRSWGTGTTLGGGGGGFGGASFGGGGGKG